MEKRIATGVVQRAAMEDWLNIALWITFFVLMVGSVLIVVSKGWSQTSGVDPKLTYHSGQVTAKRGNIIQINNQDYTMRSDVVIEDDEGRPREEKDLQPGTEVNFHLKQGTIDQIIIRLPR